MECQLRMVIERTSIDDYDGCHICMMGGTSN